MSEFRVPDLQVGLFWIFTAVFFIAIAVGGIYFAYYNWKAVLFVFAMLSLNATVLIMERK